MVKRLVIQRRLWLAFSVVLGLGLAAVLLAAAPARPALAAAAQPAPAACVNDDLEPNNYYTQATSLNLPAVRYDRQICNDQPTPTDHDFYSLSLAAGQRVQVYAQFPLITGDLDLYLYSANGSTIVAFGNNIADNESLDYTAPGAGVYYLEVVGYVGAENAYDLSVSGGCFAHAVTDFASADALAVRAAVAQAAPGSTVKIAGYCPGVAEEGVNIQTVLVTKTLTLAGGYAPGAWTVAHPLTQPTTLDAMHGGHVIFATAALTLTGFTVQKGAGSAGAGLLSTGSVVISGMTFFSNTAASSGGGAYVVGTAVLTNTSFVDNLAATVSGGGLAANAAQVSGGRFERNQALKDGGGLSVTTSLLLAGPLFDSNQAGVSGGGAFAQGAAVVAGAVFQHNQAQFGGGLYAAGALSLTGGTFLDNQALFGGGLATASSLSVINTVFDRNRAAGGGGLTSVGALSLQGVSLANNTAQTGGGVLAYGSLQITATTFTNNQAADVGGGLAQIVEAQLAAPARPAANPAPGRLVNNLFSGNTAATGLDLALLAPLSNTLLHGTFVGGGSPLTASVTVSAGNLTVRNSLFSGYPLAIQRTGGSVSEDYDLFFGGGGTVAGYLSGGVTSGGHSLVADPLLVNAAGGDDHLTFLSPARDRGLELGVTTDFEGDRRPIGPRPDIGYDEVYWRLELPVVVR